MILVRNSLPSSWLELKKPLGWELKCLQGPETSSAAYNLALRFTMTWIWKNVEPSSTFLTELFINAFIWPKKAKIACWISQASCKTQISHLARIVRTKSWKAEIQKKKKQENSNKPKMSHKDQKKYQLKAKTKLTKVQSTKYKIKRENQKPKLETYQKWGTKRHLRKR